MCFCFIPNRKEFRRIGNEQWWVQHQSVFYLQPCHVNHCTHSDVFLSQHFPTCFVKVCTHISAVQFSGACSPGWLKQMCPEMIGKTNNHLIGTHRETYWLYMYFLFLLHIHYIWLWRRLKKIFLRNQNLHSFFFMSFKCCSLAWRNQNTWVFFLHYILPSMNPHKDTLSPTRFMCGTLIIFDSLL